MTLRKEYVAATALVLGVAIAAAADRKEMQPKTSAGTKSPSTQARDGQKQTAQPQPAQLQATQNKAGQSQPVQVQAAQGGLTVFIDPATGKFREPEPGELAQLSPAPPAVSLAKPVMIFGPTGAIGALTGPEHMSYSVARIASDGKLHLDCVDGEAKAESVLRTPARKEQADEK